MLRLHTRDGKECIRRPLREPVHIVIRISGGVLIKIGFGR